MRTIERASRFKRDFKRESRGRYRAVLEVEFIEIIRWLASDTPMPERYQDHALSGDWINYRDCHIKPDLVLVYRKSNDDVLELARLGSHSELGF